MKFKEIVTLATKFKTSVEKNHTFPAKITMNGKTYNYGTIGYYFTEFIKNGGKEVKDKTIKNNSDSAGVTINEKIKESDFKDQIKRISQFIQQNGKLPNNVTTVVSKKKVKPQDYIYAFSKIVVFYGTNYRFPAYCTYNSSVYTKKSTPKKKTSSKYGHATKHGCDNMGQNTPYYCGCHSLQEIFRNLTGKVVPQKTIAKICGTTSAGTDHNGLNTCVAWFNKRYDFKLKVTWKNFSDIGWNGVKKIVESDNQDCLIHNLYRNKYGHYEVVNGVSSNNIKVQNSLGDKCTSSCYCGYVENRSPSEYRSYIAGISQKSIMIITRS